MDLINQLNDFMAQMGVDYAICGGHAIDLFLGRKTRPHKDLDVAVYWDDRNKIVQHMLDAGWDVYEPCGTTYLHKINSVAEQKRIKSNIWCVKPSNTHYKFTEHEKNMYAVDFDNSEQVELDYIEFLFNTREDGAFLYAKDHSINLGMDKAILEIDGIPYLAPEMILLYKSSAADDFDYQLDFDNSSKKLSVEQTAWLKKSLSVMFPDGHKWLDALENT